MSSMSSRPSHTPRKKRGSDQAAVNAGNGALTSDGVNGSRPAFPLAAFLLPSRGSVSQWITLPLVLIAAGLFRWSTGFWGYSGFQSPPMHGDFEAQRHWLELTINLPMSHWYFHDLEWWGLDYPPLTAYHSWILGKIGNLLNESWFTLRSSRGLDDPDLKLFMRATVFVSEYVVLVPACVICLRHLSRLSGVNTWESIVALTALLMQPATMLIDHGHFQYNTVMLGLVLATLSSMLGGRPLWSCVYFVAALGFKQMALFYAPAVFAYLLGICMFPRLDPVRLLCIAVVTAVSFALLFLPLLAGALYDANRKVPLPSDIQIPPLMETISTYVSKDAWYYPMAFQLAQSIHRIFPFARGLFEDKVANIWCAIHSSGVYKLNHFPASTLSRAALALTTLSIAPPCAIIFLRPKKSLLPWAFAATSWGFFLCSYQVHEKNVLLPLLPMTILLAADAGLKPAMRAWIGFANILATWTLFPLLRRDELRIPYFVLTLLWAYLMGLPPTSLSLYVGNQSSGLLLPTKVVHLLFYSAMFVWHVADGFFIAPASKPDLWTVGNACIGAAGFGICYLWCLWNLLVKSQLFATVERADARSKKAL